MSGKSYGLLYKLRMYDGVSTKLSKINGASRKVESSLGSVSGKMNKLKGSMRQVVSEVPGFNSGLRLLNNPIIALGSLATGAAIGLNKLTKEAIDFNSSFRELRNLNLNKTIRDMGVLRDVILNTSFDKGFDPNKTIRAFYDIQSVTGKYGNEVKKIVEMEGRFAEVMQADFNQWIEGTGKAMANYGFGAEKLREYNKSAYSTVKLGSITFDQLSKVQATYAGAAAAAKQSFDSANTLMTLFTLKTKSAEEAATLTKSAFTDLFKPATIKAFRKNGIEPFDKITGKTKQVTQLITELNKKFMALGNDKAINNLRNQFKGSEGLLALLQVSSDRTGNLKRTLEDINRMKFNYTNALNEANKDAAVQIERLHNQIKSMNIQIGIEMLPVEKAWTEFRLKFLQKFNTWYKGISAVNKEITDERVYSIQEKYKKQLSLADKLSPEKFNSVLKELYHQQDIEGKLMADYKYQNNKKGYFYYAKDNQVSIKTAVNEVKDFYSRHTAFQNAYRKLIKQFNEYRNNPLVNPFRSTKQSSSNDDNTSIQSGLSGISGGGTQMKSITVNIGKLNESININTTKLEEGEHDIEQKITELLIRSIAGAEQIIGEG